MRYITSYSIHPATALQGFPESCQFSILGVEVELNISSKDEYRATYKVSIPVEPTGLSVRVGEQPLDGSSPQEGIAVPESKQAVAATLSLTRALTFILDTPLRNDSLPGGSLISECADDDVVLASLKNRPVFVDLRGEIAIKAPSFEAITPYAMKQLLSKEVGLAIYSDALHISTEIGKFRELWKVLESAFGQKDTALLKSLGNFTPVAELGFDATELKNLHILRGRASHAESSAGLNEYKKISSEVAERLSRLKCLVDQILLTKQSWGNKGTGIDRLADLKTYVREDGMPVLIRPEMPEDEAK
jgi:hypothetical protein